MYQFEDLTRTRIFFEKYLILCNNTNIYSLFIFIIKYYTQYKTKAINPN